MIPLAVPDGAREVVAVVAGPGTGTVALGEFSLLSRPVFGADELYVS